MITEITFDEIFPIWKNHLWPNRVSQIEPSSAMNFLGGYDIANMKNKCFYFAYKINDDIVGVNSGHLCKDKSFRSRGLYVFPEHRGNNIGVSLLKHTIRQARNLNSNYCWSYPKKSSWKTYNESGFMLASDWEKSELDINAYCVIHFD